MRTHIVSAVFVLTFAAACARAGDTAVTIYNQDFGVVRDIIPLELTKGDNHVSFKETTTHLEPDSVILRDPAGKVKLQILEQNYRADPVSQQLLLSLFEGKTIDFQITRGDKVEIVQGKIVRSGYAVHSAAMRRYGQNYYQSQMGYAGGMDQPIIEVNGKLQFQLPGTPLFPALGDDTILKPTIEWVLSSDKKAKLDAELCYVTGGMSWEADYNIVAPEKGEMLDLVGWVTMDNQSGKSFENAKIKLMAGDVSKIQPQQMARASLAWNAEGGYAGGPPVTEKAFEEYHLYTLDRRTTLRDRETKQVEFVRAANVKSKTLYIYDGLKVDRRYMNWDEENIRNQRNYGTQCNTKVWVMREFENRESSGLGMPLPKGRMRFYRQDSDGQLEFTGENTIDHTPKDEKIRVYTGNAFDLAGERRQTNFNINISQNWADESFEIKVRNHKTTPVDVRVVEHLYRALSWEITAKSQDFTKTDSRTIEFPVTIAPDGEATITYTVHYTW